MPVLASHSVIFFHPTRPRLLQEALSDVIGSVAILQSKGPGGTQKHRDYPFFLCQQYSEEPSPPHPVPRLPFPPSDYMWGSSCNLPPPILFTASLLLELQTQLSSAVCCSSLSSTPVLSKALLSLPSSLLSSFSLNKDHLHPSRPCVDLRPSRRLLSPHLPLCP